MRGNNAIWNQEEVEIWNLLRIGFLFEFKFLFAVVLKRGVPENRLLLAVRVHFLAVANSDVVDDRDDDRAGAEGDL